MKNEKFLTTGKKITVLIMTSLIIGCAATPTPPPSWPSGEERPINKAPALNQVEVENVSK